MGRKIVTAGYEWRGFQVGDLVTLENDARNEQFEIIGFVEEDDGDADVMIMPIESDSCIHGTSFDEDIFHYNYDVVVSDKVYPSYLNKGMFRWEYSHGIILKDRVSIGFWTI